MVIILALYYCFLAMNYYNKNHLSIKEDGEIYQDNLGLLNVFLKMYIINSLPSLLISYRVPRRSTASHPYLLVNSRTPSCLYR